MKHIFFSLIFLMICAASNATHNRAGQIVYRHISGYTYEFTHTQFYYTPSPAWRGRTSLNVSWGDGQTGRIPLVECENLPNNITKCVYRTIHTFPGPGIYTITVEDPNRNAGISNIPGSVNVVFSVQTILRIDPNFRPNNAPIFLRDPVDRAAVGRRFVHNPSAFDIDGDSLSYELVICTRERGVEIETYQFPDGLTVNAVTGDLVWDVPDRVGMFNVCLRVNEYRDGVRIGSVTRDMQIEVVESNNNPPEMPVFRDTCIIAGESISISFKITDPDDDLIVLTATGGPFQVATNRADLTIDSRGPGYLYATFTWQTDFSHVRNQPYTVVFKAEDDNSEVRLASFANFNITVIAPPVENLTAVAERRAIVLEWFQSVCDHAAGYEIFRSIGNIDFDLEHCETGIPTGLGYERIAVLNGRNNTFFRDNNDGRGLSPGIRYCYRVVAFFSDGARSLPSNEDCASLPAGMPPMIRAHVNNIDDDAGEIHVAWLEKPILEKIADNPGPFEYRLFYSMDMDDWSSVPLHTSLVGSNDTTFVHTARNTKTAFPHYYKVELWDLGNNVIVEEDYEIASTFFPVLEPSDKSVIITFGRFTPWINETYDIFRIIGEGIPDITPEFFVARSHREIFTDVGLRNGQEYCYRIVSTGYRYIDGIRYENYNWSHVACVTPVDNVAPCPPVIEAVSICEENRNELTWAYIPTCMYDFEKFHIYFTPDPRRQPSFERAGTVYRDENWHERDIYTWSHIGSLIGCYHVTAVDSAGNVSIWSNIICLDECGEYQLPNVFTPNNDNINDVFIAYNPGRVTRVNMQIFNRWGQLVFETTDPDINWDGRNMNTGRFVPTGVYYYVCDVYEERLTGTNVFTLSGFIHVYLGDDAQPWTPPYH